MHEPVGPHDPDRVIMPALLAACPSFDSAWRDHIATWPDEGERGIYADIAAFAHHLVNLLGDGTTAEFPDVFAATERLIRDGDPGIRYAMKVGLLEDLGNSASHQGWSFAAQFRAWFGPATSTAWDELHKEWGTSD